MKRFKSLLLAVISICISTTVFCQEVDPPRTKIDNKDLKQAEEDGEDVYFQRPFNFFASAGVSYRLQSVYDVTVSPIDNSVQFEKLLPLHSALGTGLVWQPIWKNYMVFNYNGPGVDTTYERVTWPFAVALLVDVLDLSYSGSKISKSSPIDVGFGLGFRTGDFLVLATVEFSYLRQPREYFKFGYKEKDIPLILNGSQEPVRTISVDDNSLFYDKMCPSIGIRMAYAFNTKDK